MPLPNFYKPFSIEGKTDLSEGSAPSEADRNNAIFKLNLHGYTSLFRHAVSSTSFKSDTTLVRPHKFPIPTSVGCASPKLSLHALVRKKKKKMLQSETGNNHCRTRVMSQLKRVGLA